MALPRARPLPPGAATHVGHQQLQLPRFLPNAQDTSDVPVANGAAYLHICRRERMGPGNKDSSIIEVLIYISVEDLPKDNPVTFIAIE